MARAILLAVLGFAPGYAFAANTIVGFSRMIQQTIYRPLIGVIIGFALVLFLWGVVKYIRHAGDQKSADEGAKMMSYGVLVLFVMVCVWGIVRLGLAFLGFEGGQDGSGSTTFGLSNQTYQQGSGGPAAPGSGGDYDYNFTYDY